MKKKFVKYFLVGGILFFSGYATAEKSQLDGFFSELKTLTAAFDQIVEDVDGRVVQKTAGILNLQRPEKFSWIYEKPVAQHIVSDGKNIWIYDLDLEQVTVKPVTQLLTDTPAMLLAKSSLLNEKFLITDRGSVKNYHWFELIPKASQSNIKVIKIALEKENGMIKMMAIKDSFEQTTRLSFKQVAYNQPIEDEIFRFQLPKGVDLIGVPID